MSDHILCCQAVLVNAGVLSGAGTLRSVFCAKELFLFMAAKDPDSEYLVVVTIDVYL